MTRFLLALTAALLATPAPAADPPAAKRAVGILIFPGVEMLDFAGPYEVFTVAHRHAGAEMLRLYDVRVVAATPDPVATSGGLKVVPTNTFADCPKLDVLVVPGGPGTRLASVGKDRATLDWVRRQAGGAEVVESVCTGAFVLAEAGLLDGKRAATHQMWLDRLGKEFPKVTVVAGRRVVTDGKVVTAAGVASGLDASLAVVARLNGDGAAKMVAEIIEYPYPAK